MDNLVARLLTFAGIEDASGGTCDYRLSVSLLREAADAIEALQAQLADERDKALEEAAQTAETRHGVWLGLGADCLVDDDISACSDIAAAIRAMKGERG
jgi:hypothetical protein